MPNSPKSAHVNPGVVAGQETSDALPWTIKRAYNWTKDYLEKKGDSDSRISTEWLIGDACNLTRIEVYMEFEKPLSTQERTVLRDYVSRRAAGEPLQYILGKHSFRYLTLDCTPGVLIPRPETETLVDLVLERLPKTLQAFIPASIEESSSNDQAVCERGTKSNSVAFGEGLHVLDLCTGSGCVGLSIAHERRDVSVTATDVSPQALALAKKNAQDTNLDSRVNLLSSDLFAEISKDSLFDIIVSNPPYIPSAGMEELPAEIIDFEPELALHGGKDGLDFARRILDQAQEYLKEGGFVILELDSRNVHAARDYAVLLNTYKTIDVVCDLTGRDRFLIVS